MKMLAARLFPLASLAFFDRRVILSDMQPEQAYLTLIQNGEQKQVYTFTEENVVSIGRSPENTVSFFDERCSRFHAKLSCSDGHWFVQDLGSRNGTFVDHVKIGTNTRRLYSGQQIQIGRVFLNFGFGSPDDCDTKVGIETGSIEPSPIVNDNDIDESDHFDNTVEQRTGVFGVSKALQGPVADEYESVESEIVHTKSHTSLLGTDSAGAPPSAVLPTTRAGFGPAEMCRLAYQIGQAEEVDLVARTALEGLLAATHAEGAGLWLFPYSLHSKQQASDIRLVAENTVNKTQYTPISATLARTVFEKQEAFLVHENPNEGTKKIKKVSDSEASVSGSAVLSESAKVEVNNTLVAPIRFQGGILGMLHLYTSADGQFLEESDLEYALAIADTVGVALAGINRRKELATNLTQTQKENVNLREMLQVNSEIVGSSPEILTVHHLIARAAEAKTAILIRGESGTGKELIARAVHLASPRKAKPFICLNCAAISETLLESELFGHEKGAFTGATERKLGKFEVAHTGTLFLDEIGEMSPALQAKMLRVLENSAFERVGGNTTITIDVRILTATHRDLEKEVAAGRFRHDLFFRLRVLEIMIPPLRKRPTDIPVLAAHFLERFCLETGRKYTGFHPVALETLMNHRWPGNVRELKNIIERAVVMGAEPLIRAQDVLLSKLGTVGESQIIPPEKNEREMFIPISLSDMERNHIIRTLDYTDWNKAQTAKLLGVERTTLDRKIKRYNIEM